MKFFKYIGICSIVLFSFYYAEKISNFVLEENKLYKEIESKKDNYGISSVSAQIDDDYIVPGLTGKEVNVKDSYFNMKDLEGFNDYYLVYSIVSPEVSLLNNKDKIIKSGNANKNSINFILENDETIKNYFIQNNISANILIDYDDFNSSSFLEQINNDVNKYKALETLLSNNSLNSSICVLSKNIENICREKEKYLIEPTILSDTTFLKEKGDIKSGKIYLIKKGMNIDNLKIFIKTVSYKGLSIVNLSELIDEQR